MKNTVFISKSLVALILVFLLGGMTVGCQPKKKAELTPEQVTQSVSLVTEMRQALAPMLSEVVSDPKVVGYGENGAGAQTFLSDADRDKCLEYLRQAKARYAASPEGESALQQLGVDFRQLAEQAHAQKRWRLVMAAIDATKILDPSRTDLDLLREQAKAYWERPDVVIKGFLDDVEKGQVYALLQITLRPSGEQVSVHVRKGDEFNGLRFVDVVGNLRGVKLEYLKIPGDFFTIMYAR